MDDKLNYLMYIDAIKLIAKNERELESLMDILRIHT